MADEPTTPQNAPQTGDNAPQTGEMTPEQLETHVREALDKDRAETPERSENQRFADNLIANALTLRVEARDHQRKVSASRDMLRNLATLDELTPTQTTAVNLLYPNRERKAKTTDAPAAAPLTPNGNPGVAAKPKPKPAPAAA